MIPRWSIPCLTFLLLLGGAWLLWNGNETEVERVEVLVCTDSRKAGLGESRQGGAEFIAAVAMPWTENGRQAAGAKPVATVGNGAAALLAEEIELRALGASVELALTERQWTAFAGVTLLHQAVRHAYEAEIAVATLLADGRQRLEIPAYVGAGAALRTEFYKALLKELGESAAMDVVRKLSRRLEVRFAGFGAAVQTLDFSGEWTGGASGAVGTGFDSVTRTVVFWNESNADEALRTRRETIFPRLEDPDGLQWGPLLARVEAAAQVPGKKARG